MELKEKKVLIKFIQEHEKQILDEYSPHYIESQELSDFIDEEM